MSKRQIGTEEPAALISAGCEVIQIKKKFFIKFLDDNMRINIEHLVRLCLSIIMLLIIYYFYYYFIILMIIL